MTTGLTDRPFTRQVRALTHRFTYERIAQRVGYARSTTWLNNLVNRELMSGRGWSAGPPEPTTWAKFAEAFGVTVDDVRRMIAHEWLQVKQADHSERVTALATRLDKLSDEDAELISQLVSRLQPADKRAKKKGRTDDQGR
jgi:hypothetical protein